MSSNKVDATHGKEITSKSSHDIQQQKLLLFQGASMSATCKDNAQFILFFSINEDRERTLPAPRQTSTRNLSQTQATNTYPTCS